MSSYMHNASFIRGLLPAECRMERDVTTDRYNLRTVYPDGRMRHDIYTATWLESLDTAGMISLANQYRMLCNVQPIPLTHHLGGGWAPSTYGAGVYGQSDLTPAGAYETYGVSHDLIDALLERDEEKEEER